MKQRIFSYILLLVMFLMIACQENKYKITFVGLNDEVIKTIEVGKKEKIEYPIINEIEGYTFVGFDTTIEYTDSNIIIKALFEVKKITVTFVDKNDVAFKTEQVEYNGSVNAPAAPIVEGYEFVEYDKKLENLKIDTIIKAIYKKSTYKVVFMDDEDNILKDLTVEYGDKVEAPTIEKEGYDFKGWDCDYSNIKSDLTIKPLFSKKVYTVKYFDIEKELVHEEKVAYKEDAKGYSINVEGYDFTGYSEDITNVTSNLEVYLNYTKKEFSIKFIENEIVIKEIKAYYNDVYVRPDLEKAGYILVNVENEPTLVIADVQINVEYEIKKYEIKYYDNDSLLQLEPNQYNIETSVNLPNPEKTGYTFDGWYTDNSFTSRVSTINIGEYGDRSLYSKWIKDEEEFVMPVGAFTMGLKQIPHSMTGAMVYQPSINSDAPSTSALAYEWSSSDTSIATISTYSTISPAGSGFVIIKGTYKNDSTIVGYLLLKVSPTNITIATADDVNNKEKYTVRFLDYDSSVISTQQVSKGKNAVLPKTPVRDGYSFFGWDTSFIDVQSNLDIKATYIEGQLNLENKKVSIMGDSITTYNKYIPEGFSYFYPYSTSHVGDVTQTWWMQVINKYGMQLLVNDSWSGTYTYGTNNSAAESDYRISLLEKDSVKPDIILVFMGMNDCGSGFATSVFKAAYLRMLNKMEIKYPNAEIILCTLSKETMTSKYPGRNAEYNTEILAIAKERNYKVFRFDLALPESNFSDYLCDSVHPNKEGMELLANQAIKDLKK